MSEEPIQADKILYTTDSENKEIDTKEALDIHSHRWLGEVLVNGVWEKDPDVVPMMNKDGVALLMSEIGSRFNTHTHFTVLSEQDIRDMICDSCINISRIIKYDYWRYGMRAKHTTAICDQVKDALMVFLNIPLMGGFRQYRENKTKTVINKIERGGDE